MKLQIGSIEVNITVNILLTSSSPATDEQNGHKVVCPDCEKVIGVYDTEKQAKRALAGHYAHCEGGKSQGDPVGLSPLMQEMREIFERKTLKK